MICPQCQRPMQEPPQEQAPGRNCSLRPRGAHGGAEGLAAAATHGVAMLKQPNPEGLHAVAWTHAGLYPVGGTPAGAWTESDERAAETKCYI